MAARTRLGLEGYGVRRAGSFASKAGTGGGPGIPGDARHRRLSLSLGLSLSSILLPLLLILPV